jgi:hypothetical protein
MLTNVCGKDVHIAGGLIRIGRLEADQYYFVDDPEQMIERLRNCGTRIDLFTFLQRLPETTPKYSYPMVWDNLAVLAVSTFENWWDNQIRSYPRNRARQAEKRGVTIRETTFDEALVQGIWEIYNECPLRQGKPFLHYGKSIDAVREMSATFPDSSIFIGAYLGHKLIGFVKLVTDETRTQTNLMHIVSMIQHKDKAPTNALIAQSVRSCAARGIRYLVYQNFSYGKKQADSLSHFKEINGFQRVDLPRYYVPLTSIGWAAFRLGLYNSIWDRIPEPVAATFRRARSFWYAKRFPGLERA